MTQWRRAMFFRHGQDLHIFSPFIFIHRGYISQFSIWVSKEKVTLALLVDILNLNSGGWENSQICLNPLRNYIWFLRDVQCWGEGIIPMLNHCSASYPLNILMMIGKIAFPLPNPQKSYKCFIGKPRNPFKHTQESHFFRVSGKSVLRKGGNQTMVFLEGLIIKKWRCPSSIFPSNSVSGESPPFFVDRQIQHCRFHSSTWSKMQWGVFVC